MTDSTIQPTEPASIEAQSSDSDAETSAVALAEKLIAARDQPADETAQPEGDTSAEQGAEPETASDESTDEPAKKQADKQPDETEKPPTHKQWVALTKRKQAVVEREKQLEQRFSRFEAEKSEVVGRLQKLQELETLAKSDPAKLISLLGVDLATLNQRVLEEGSPEAETRRLAGELAELKQARENETKQKNDTEKNNFVSQVNNGFSQFVSSQADNFPLASKLDFDELTRLGDQVANDLAGRGVTFASFQDFAAFHAEGVERLLQQQLKRFGVSIPSKHVEKPVKKPTAQGGILTNRRQSAPAPSKPTHEATDEERFAEAAALANRMIFGR